MPEAQPLFPLKGRSLLAQPTGLQISDAMTQTAYRLHGSEVATIDYVRDFHGETGPGDAQPRTLVTVTYADGQREELRFGPSEPMILE
jgi:hypothetical protein